MAEPLTAARLADALRAEGVNVVERPGWRTHNRGTRGTGWGPINGVMIHHTVTSGTAGSVRLCEDGYAGLPGPLCHGVINKAGTVYLVGNGRANHAGLGDDEVLRAVIAERSSLPEPNERNTDGNSRFYGFECINLGDGKDPWPDAQLDAIERAGAAICRAYGWKAASVIGHAEWSYTKIDPRGFSMEEMRRRIHDRLEHDPDHQEQEDEDMPIRTSLGKSEAQALPWGEFSVIRWDQEYADHEHAHANGNYPGYIAPVSSWADFDCFVRVRGLELGDEYQLRYEVHDWDDGSTGQWSEIHADAPATRGTQFMAGSMQKGLSAGQHCYVAIKPIPGPGHEDAPPPVAYDGRYTIRQDKE